MDLSLKKPRQETTVVLDVPQDLSIKRRRTDPEPSKPEKSKSYPQRNIIGISEFDFYAYLAASTLKESSSKYTYSAADGTKESSTSLPQKPGNSMKEASRKYPDKVPGVVKSSESHKSPGSVKDSSAKSLPYHASNSTNDCHSNRLYSTPNVKFSSKATKNPTSESDYKSVVNYVPSSNALREASATYSFKNSTLENSVKHLDVSKPGRESMANHVAKVPRETTEKDKQVNPFSHKLPSAEVSGGHFVAKRVNVLEYTGKSVKTEPLQENTSASAETLQWDDKLANKTDPTHIPTLQWDGVCLKSESSGAQTLTWDELSQKPDFTSMPTVQWDCPSDRWEGVSHKGDLRCVRTSQTFIPEVGAVKRKRRRKQEWPKRVLQQDLDCVGSDSDSDISFTEIYRAVYPGCDPDDDTFPSAVDSVSSTRPFSGNTGLNSLAHTGDTVSKKGNTCSDPDESLLTGASTQPEGAKTNLPTVLDDNDDDDTNDDSGLGVEASDNSSDVAHAKSSSSAKNKCSRRGSSTCSMLQERERRRQQKLFGKEYRSPSGKVHPERKVRDKDCSKCRYSCSQNISPAQRQAIFDHFWQLDTYVKRLYYYCHNIKEKPAKSMTQTRECSREYTFLIGNERVRVCKGFYLATLDVTDKAVRIAMEKRKKGVSLFDKRSLQPPVSKNRELSATDRVLRHMEEYLLTNICIKNEDGEDSEENGEVNLARMYHSYKMECRADGKTPVTENAYSEIFETQFNLSCHKVD